MTDGTDTTIDAPTETTDRVMVPVEFDRLQDLVELHGGDPERAVADAVDVFQGLANPAEVLAIAREHGPPDDPRDPAGEGQPMVERYRELVEKQQMTDGPSDV